MLNLVRVHDPVDGRSLRIHERRRIAAYRNAFGNLSQFKLNIQGVGLFRDDAEILEYLLFEARLLDREGKLGRGKGVEVVNSVPVARSSQFLIGIQIR